MNKATRKWCQGALAAACSALPLAPAGAADLGGDCCADLEERIAELESTTARKGNRKVSLTVSGYVAHELTWWDDGIESNAYLHDLGPTQASNVRFHGSAKISPDWQAGYMIRLQVLDANPFGRTNQDNAHFNQGVNLQMSYWYIESASLGTVSVGKQVHAAKSAAMFTDKSGTQLFDNYTFLGGFPNFFLNSNGNRTAFTWGQMGFCYVQGVPLGGDCNGIVMSGVRYDTPVLAGFKFSASWGEDDFWEVAARYTGELSGFKILLGVGYSEFTDENTTGVIAGLVRKDSSFFQAGGYIEHAATGLFLHGSYGYGENSGTIVNGLTPPDSDQWYVKAGIRKAWTPLGATIVYGDYAAYYDQIGPALLGNVTSSKLERFGGGIAQEIDAAAMTVYLKYQRYEGDVTSVAGFTALDDIDSVDFVSMGAVINF